MNRTPLIRIPIRLDLMALLVLIPVMLLALTGCQASREPMPTVRPSYSYSNDEQRKPIDQLTAGSTVARVQPDDEQ